MVDSIKITIIKFRILLANSMKTMWTMSNDFIELVELSFLGSQKAGLFGNRDDLLAEWQPKIEGRLPLVTTQRPDE